MPKKRVGNYHLHETLGTGTFGKVKLAKDAEGNEFAIKIMDKKMIRNKNLVDLVRGEVAAMKLMPEHKNVVNLIEVLESKSTLYLVMEVALGGELFDKLKQEGGQDERMARKYFRQLIRGLEFCHRRGVCHRDLKLENLILNRDGTLKITDFGLSGLIQSQAQGGGSMFDTTLGSPNYIAPEVLNARLENYDGFKSDIWAAGVILYALLAGYLPFDEKNPTVLFQKISTADFQFPGSFSHGVADLLSNVLLVNTEQRWTIDDIKGSEWFNMAEEDDASWAEDSYGDGRDRPHASGRAGPPSDLPVFRNVVTRRNTGYEDLRAELGADLISPVETPKRGPGKASGQDMGEFDSAFRADLQRFSTAAQPGSGSSLFDTDEKEPGGTPASRFKIYPKAVSVGSTACSSHITSPRLHSPNKLPGLSIKIDAVPESALLSMAADDSEISDDDLTGSHTPVSSDRDSLGGSIPSPVQLSALEFVALTAGKALRNMLTRTLRPPSSLQPTPRDLKKSRSISRTWTQFAVPDLPASDIIQRIEVTLDSMPDRPKYKTFLATYKVKLAATRDNVKLRINIELLEIPGSRQQHMVEFRRVSGNVFRYQEFFKDFQEVWKGSARRSSKTGRTLKPHKR